MDTAKKSVAMCWHVCLMFSVGDANPDLFKDDSVVDVSDLRLHIIVYLFLNELQNYANIFDVMLSPDNSDAWEQSQMVYI